MTSRVLVYLFTTFASSIAILSQLVPETMRGAPFYDGPVDDWLLLFTTGVLALVSSRLGKLLGCEWAQLRTLISLFVLSTILLSGERISKVLTVGFEDIVRDVLKANSNSQYRWTALAITVPQLYFLLDLAFYIKPLGQCTDEKDRAKASLMSLHHVISLFFWFVAFYSTCGVSIVGLGFLLTELGGLGKLMPHNVWTKSPILYGIVFFIYTFFRILLVLLGCIIISVVWREAFQTHVAWSVYAIAVLSAAMIFYSVVSVRGFWNAFKRKWLA